MDEFDRFMSRQRALRRARRSGGQAGDLWGFERWGEGGVEEHHPGRRKFNYDQTITVPKAMHPELTRRGEEEHPPLGPDPANPLEGQGRLFLGWSDMFEALAHICRWIGEQMLAAAEGGRCDNEAGNIPSGLLCWVARIAHDLARATEKASGASGGG